MTTAAQKKKMVKNMTAANINGVIIACKACITKGRPTRFIIPDFQPTIQSKCTWCSKVISKSSIGRTFTKIGCIENGITRYYNGKKKLVNFDDLTNTEKAGMGLTPKGEQKQSSRKYY